MYGVWPIDRIVIRIYGVRAWHIVFYKNIIIIIIISVNFLTTG